MFVLVMAHQVHRVPSVLPWLAQGWGAMTPKNVRLAVQVRWPRHAKILPHSACASASWPLQLAKAAVEVRKVPSLEITLRSSGKTATCRTWTNAAGIMFAPQGENIVTLWVKQ